MNKQNGFINLGGIQYLAYALVIAGILIGFLMFEGLPWLWELIKPWLHGITI